MHVALNAYFWNRPETGSGQYLRRMVWSLTAADSTLRLTLVHPGRAIPIEPLPDRARWHPVKVRRGHLGKVLFEQFGFPDACEDLEVDLAHVPYWGSPLSSPVPVVVTVHDLIPLVLRVYRGGLAGTLYTSLVAAAARGAQMVITDSNSAREDILKRLKLAPERVRAIYLAAEKRFSPGRPDPKVVDHYRLPERYVLYLGGFDVRKNVEALLRAYKYVGPAIGDEYPLVLAGRLPAGSLRRFTDVSGLIETLGIGKWVRSTGYVDEMDKPDVYRGASVLAQLSHYEGFGLPPLEAMACGVPVVVSERSSLPEVVGAAGFVLDPDDVEGVAGAIIACATDEGLREDLRRRGLQQAGRFSWADTARETLEVYKEAVRLDRARG